MKIKVDVECTPEEARTFLGLPDVKPMQDALLQQAQERMSAAMQAMDPETMMRTWMPAGVQSFENLQKFWTNFTAAAGRGKGKE